MGKIKSFATHFTNYLNYLKWLASFYKPFGLVQNDL